MPPYVIYGKGKTVSCNIDVMFKENARLVINYVRTIFCVEILAMCILYFCIAKEIRTLINTVENSSFQQQKITRIGVQPLSPGTSFPVHVSTSVQRASSNVGDFEENAESGSSSQMEISRTITKSLSSVMKDETVQMPHTQERSTAGLAWKLRAFKMVRFSLLSTILPSIPMIVTQIVGYIRPDLLNETVDIIVSLCNVVHAIVYPLMFIVFVKN
jgi:hypothetical protein